MEPAYWPDPVRRTLGAVYLQADRAQAAIEAFEASLAQAPRDGRALWGLMQAWYKVSHDQEDRDDYRSARAAFCKARLGDEAILDLNRL